MVVLGGVPSGEQIEGDRVVGPHDPEVPFVERGDHGDPEPFRHGHDACVDEAETQIGWEHTS